MDYHQNLEYDFLSKSRSGSYPDMSMIFHPNLGYGLSSKSRV